MLFCELASRGAFLTAELTAKDKLGTVLVCLTAGRLRPPKNWEEQQSGGGDEAEPGEPVAEAGVGSEVAAEGVGGVEFSALVGG